MKMFKQETQFCILLNPLFPGRKGEGLKFTDEPTGNLDSKTAVEVIGLLKASSQKYHQTVMMVTHNEALAQTCDRIIRIEDGRLYQREDAFYGEGGEL